MPLPRPLAAQLDGAQGARGQRGFEWEICETWVNFRTSYFMVQKHQGGNFSSGGWWEMRILGAWRMQLQLATFATVTPSLTAAATLLTYFSRRYADFEIIYSTKERERDMERGRKRRVYRSRKSRVAWRVHASDEGSVSIITKRCPLRCILRFVPLNNFCKPCFQAAYCQDVARPTFVDVAIREALLMQRLKYVNKFRISQTANFPKENSHKPYGILAECLTFRN